MADGTGYVLRVEGVIAGYMCIDFSGEPAYAEIQGAWGAERPYAVVHRMAFSRDFRGMGLVDTAFSLIETLCLDNGVSCIRVDTDFPNKRMSTSCSKTDSPSGGPLSFRAAESWPATGFSHDAWPRQAPRKKRPCKTGKTGV